MIVAVCFSCIGINQAGASIDVRFYPSKVWLHDIDAARQVSSAVVQNAALVNTGDHPVTVARVRFEVLRAGQIILSMPLHAASLDTAAQNGSAMQKAGMLEALDFQFAPQQLLGEDVTLASTRTLAPGTALLVPSQLLVFSAPADEIQVTVEVQGSEDISGASLPIRGDVAAKPFRFPLEGRWWIGAGANAHQHHRWMVPQEFALDIARVGASGATFSGDGEEMSDYYAWGAPVRAAASGEVVVAVDQYPDNTKMLRRRNEPITDYRKRLFATQNEWLTSDVSAISGNHVILRHADDMYSVYAHLQRGSVTVKVGQELPAGAQLARLGSSGNSTEPHLHFHVCDAPQPLRCAGVPVRFANVEMPWAERERQLQGGDLVETR